MKQFSSILTIFSSWTLVILVIFYLGFSVIPHTSSAKGDFWNNFSNWDGEHFLGIAQHGYSKEYQYAFFPLYPLLINSLTRVTDNFLLSGVLISIISTVAGLYFLYKLVTFLFDKNIARSTIIYLLIFPTSFYFLTAYSEGLYFALSVSCLYFLLKRKVFIAVILAGLASATRLVGVALFLAIVVELLTTNSLTRRYWYVVFALFGVAIYCWYLYINTGDPFYFLIAESHWQNNLSIPGLSIWEAIKALSMPDFFVANFKSFIDLLITIFGIGMVIRGIRFLPPSLFAYSIVLLGIPLLTPNLSSIPRFLLPIFPIFILLALIKNQSFIFLFQLLSIMLLAVFSVLFINGYWVS